MGLLDLFSRRKKAEDEDVLHGALQKAMVDPESREAFYDCLLHAELIVRTGEGDDKSRFMFFKDGRLPVFSSPRRFLDEPSTKTAPMHIRIAAKELFAACPGVTLHLNPFSECNKLISPVEIEYITQPPAEKARQMNFPDGHNILVCIPAEKPEAMLGFLRRHFAAFPEVSRAYLQLAAHEGSDEDPNYLVSVLLDAELDDFVRLLPEDMTRFIQAGHYVDFRPVAPGEVTEENSILFYERH